MVDSDIAPLQQEEAVFHHPEAHVAFAIATVGELVLIQHNLAVVLDRIVLSKHVNRQVLLGGHISSNSRLDLLFTRDGQPEPF